MTSTVHATAGPGHGWLELYRAPRVNVNTTDATTGATALCVLCVPAHPGVFLPVQFAAAVAHARLRLSRLELIGGSGRTAGRYASAAARAFISPTAFEQARGGALKALWERVEEGSGSLGAASSESAAGSGRLRACGC